MKDVSDEHVVVPRLIVSVLGVLLEVLLTFNRLKVCSYVRLSS